MASESLTNYMGNICKKNSENGLSLIELMIVVAIIGILAALAIPRFQGFQARARQAEAKSNLTHIYTLEMTYFGDNDSYSAMLPMGYSIDSGNGNPVTSCNIENNLGFKLTDCRKVRYSYRITSFMGRTFIAAASTGNGSAGNLNGGIPDGENLVFPGCRYNDVWSINQDKSLENQAGTDTIDLIDGKAIVQCL